MECDDPYLNGGVEVISVVPKSSNGWRKGSSVGMAAFTHLAFSYGKIAYEVTEYPIRTPSRTIETESTAA
jgi:hypothetical protein